MKFPSPVAFSGLSCTRRKVLLSSSSQSVPVFNSDPTRNRPVSDVFRIWYMTGLRKLKSGKNCVSPMRLSDPAIRSVSLSTCIWALSPAGVRISPL